MNRYQRPVWAIILCVCSPLPLCLAAAGETALEPDKEPIKYEEKRPAEGTPQAAAVNFLLLREEGKLEEAKKLLSKKCPEWKVTSMLRPASSKDDALKFDSLRYQLTEYAPDAAKVTIMYNTSGGKYHEWPCQLVKEEDKWVLK